MSDTLIHVLGLTLGWGFIIAGALLILRALFADRSRGRRRCPRCWYSMDGVPGMTCPECGRTARRERRFFRTRRRWRRAVGASLLALVGAGVLFTSGVVRFGLYYTIPTSVLVIITPVMPADWGSGPGDYVLSASPTSETPPAIPPITTSDHLRAELHARLIGDDLWDWQARMLANRVRNAARAAGMEPGLLDFSDVRDGAWLDGIPLSSRPNPDWELYELSLSGVLELLNTRGRPIESQDLVNINVRRLLPAMPATFFGPLALWWEAESLNSISRLVPALKRAAPSTPAAEDPEDWERHVQLYRELERTSLQLDSCKTIGDVFAAVSAASSVPVSVDWDNLMPGGINANRERSPTIDTGTATSILDANTRWMSDLYRVELHWTLREGTIRIVALRSDTDAPHVPAELIRVYDVRHVLRVRALQGPFHDLVAEENALVNETRGIARPRSPLLSSQAIFNGRLVVSADVVAHVAIEQHLAACAKSADGRVHDE